MIHGPYGVKVIQLCTLFSLSYRMFRSEYKLINSRLVCSVNVRLKRLWLRYLSTKRYIQKFPVFCLGGKPSG